MLTEQERTNLQQQISVLADKLAAKDNEREELNSFIQTNITVWLKKRFAKLTSQFKVSAYLDYDWGEYNEETKKYDRKVTIRVNIDCLKDGERYYASELEIKVGETQTKYSSCSFDFSTEEKSMVYKFKMLNSMMNCEEEFRAYCFEMVPKHKQLCEEISELYSNKRDLERYLEDDDEERKQAKALELLKEGGVYEDGACEGWFLKVTKITDKTVRCIAAKYYGGWGDLPRAVYKMHDRTIKKEEFIHCLATEYYKPSDVDIVEEW